MVSGSQMGLRQGLKKMENFSHARERDTAVKCLAMMLPWLWQAGKVDKGTQGLLKTFHVGLQVTPTTRV